MKRKIKYLTTILLFVFLFYTLKTSYSRYSTQVEGALNNNNSLQFAKFVVNNTITDTLDFEIKDMQPGDSKVITFTIKNYDSNNASNRSDVNVTHKVKMTSYMLPLDYVLYRGTTSTTNIFTCTGNLGKECESTEYTQNFSNGTQTKYRMVVTYPQTLKNPLFMNNIDTIHLEIESWQKTS